MDKEIINADGSRNWQANILLDNVKRLEQENAELKAENDRLKKELDIALREENRWKSNFNNYRDVCRKQYQTLQEIKEFFKKEIEYFDNNDDYGQQADWIALLQIITKAEEE